MDYYLVFLVSIVILLFAFIVTLLVWRIVYLMKTWKDEFHTEPGFLCPHTFFGHPPIPIGDIVEIKYTSSIRSWNSYIFFIKMANGGKTTFTISHNFSSQRDRLERELRVQGYDGPIEYM